MAYRLIEILKTFWLAEKLKFSCAKVLCGLLLKEIAFLSESNRK